MELIKTRINGILMVRSCALLFLGACLLKTSVQIVENASNYFSFRELGYILSSCPNESKKVSFRKPLHFQHLMTWDFILGKSIFITPNIIL